MISTLEIYKDLRQTLDEKTAEKIAHHISAVYLDVQQTTTKSDVNELRSVVRDLAEAQKATEAHVGALAGRVEELAEAQKRTEARLEALAGRVEELTEAQKRTEARVEALAGRLEELAEAQKRTERRVEELAIRMDRLASFVHEMADAVRALTTRFGDIDGRTLEQQFREKAPAYLGLLLRDTRVVSVGDLGDEFDEVLSEGEWAELIRADVILRGRALLGGQRQEVYAVVEVSVTIGYEDVERAARRAALMRKKGWKVIAVVAGQEAHQTVVARAAERAVAVFCDGTHSNWEAALAAA
jgi:FtsZ-binding cell division protein ZapB